MTTLDYSSSPAARETPRVVWSWCPSCETQTDHVYAYGENKEEVLICLGCFRKEAVR